jgi:hypothetical protein
MFNLVVFWDVTLFRLVNYCRRFGGALRLNLSGYFFDCLTLKMKALRLFETSATTIIN